MMALYSLQHDVTANSYRGYETHDVVNGANDGGTPLLVKGFWAGIIVKHKQSLLMYQATTSVPLNW